MDRVAVSERDLISAVFHNRTLARSPKFKFYSWNINGFTESKLYTLKSMLNDCDIHNVFRDMAHHHTKK